MPYTDQELLNELVRCYEENGETSEKILNDSSNGFPTQPTYNNRFNSLNEARKRAGVPVVKQGQSWSKDKVVEQIKQVTEESGYFNLSMMDNSDGPNSSSLYTHFDSVSEAVKFVFPERENTVDKPSKYSKDELIEYMKECENVYGKVTINILNTDDYFPSSYPYYKLFENFEQAKELAGVETYNRNSYDYYQYSSPELIEALKECNKEMGSTLAEDIQEFDKTPSPAVYNRRFGSIVSARDIADIPQPEVNYERTVEYTSSEIIDHLKEVHEEVGDTKTETINNVDGPSAQVYRSRFGSLKNAREIAELPVTQYIKNQQWMDIVGDDLNNITGYKNSADAYIYILKLDMRGSDAYYVGQTTNPYKRIKQYITQTPKMKLNKVTENGLAATRREEYENTGTEVVDIEYIISMNKAENETKEMFMDRVIERERRESFTVAIDKNCVNVFGGR